MAMGTNIGNGPGGPGEVANNMQSNQQPPATEYTLQGVMRFLQTEWHRHERDRNAWEIEKQEMKGRIAALEGAQRRADANQKALKKYVAILEKKVKDQRDQLKGSSASASVDAQHEADAEQAKKLDRNALIQEKLRSSVAAKIPGATTEMEGVELERISDDETQRSDLKTFLDQCQAEFTYLMITPANPLPPRDSPPLPLLDELQNHVQEIAPRPAPPQGYAVKTAEPPQQVMQPQTQPMVRSTEQTAYPAAVEWPGPVSVTSRAIDEVEAQKPFPRETNEVAPAVKSMDDAWDFNDSQEPIPVSSNRPDVDVFPTADNMPKSPNRGPGSHRRKSSMSRRRSAEQELSLNALAQKAESGNFKLRYGLRGHLDTVRTVIFSGGGSPGEPEICTAGDDGLIKRFHIPRNNPVHLHNNGANTATSDLDVQADFTHRGHTGAVMCLASWSPSPNLSTGGRAQGDGWIFSGGQDSTIRVWERGRVDPKATLDGHTDAVWSLCVLPATLGAIFGQTNPYGSPDRILLASGAADGTIRVWAVSAPPQMTSPQPPAAATGRRGAGSGGRVRGNSMSSGSAFPSSPQPTVASNSPFHYTLVHSISRTNSAASPTCITALSGTGESFVVSYSDAAIIVYDTRTGEEIGNMASLETYDGTLQSSVNSVVATTVGLDQSQHQVGEEDSGGGPTGGGRAMAGSGVEGVVISGHEDRFIRFFDANSGQCTYNMLAHPAAISSLSLSPDGRELVSAGHDASLRFWSLETRSCTQEITSHRIMRGEGVCAVVWGGRWVVSGGGDGIVKVFAR